uniref:Uncharacterized protein n=1 Tax=Anguilla anguilla TaxID=7936 RepID=A0A0E9TYG9_ANGAN
MRVDSQHLIEITTTQLNQYSMLDKIDVYPTLHK